MIRNWLIATSAVALLGTGAACGGASQYVVTGTEKSVGVDGVIEITRSQEDVNEVSVLLVNLPPPERHDKGLKVFVVWLTPKDGEPVKAGRLAYDSEGRRGSLRATTPNDQVYVQVTAESSSRVAKPSDFVVVSKHVTLKSGPGAMIEGADLSQQ